MVGRFGPLVCFLFAAEDAMMLKPAKRGHEDIKAISEHINSGQIISTSAEVTPNGGLVQQGNRMVGEI